MFLKQRLTDFSDRGRTVTQKTAFSSDTIARRCETFSSFANTFGDLPKEMAMSTKTLERPPALGLRVLALVAISLAVITTQASATTNQKHFFWAPGQAPNPSSVSNDLIYHGGNAGPRAIGVRQVAVEMWRAARCVEQETRFSGCVAL
jgi:hypothetical protein